MIKGKQGSQNRIQISSRQKRASGKSVGIVHNKKIAGLDKELLSKIDDILIEYRLNNDLIPTFNKKFIDPIQSTSQLPKKEEEKLPKGLARSPSAGPKIVPKNAEPLDFDPNMPNINKEPKKKKLPQVKTKKTYKGKKDGFLTGVGLIKQTKKKDNPRTNKFLAKNDEEIKSMLNNIDEIDAFIKDPNKDNDSDLFEGSPDYRNRMAKNRQDFEELIREIDGYKKEMHEEFDEIQYLIKFTNNTEKLITRHKNVMDGIFKGAGLTKKVILEKGDPNLEGGEEENKTFKEKTRTKSMNKTKIQGYLDIINEVDNADKNNDDDSEDYNDEFLATSVSELNGVFYKLKKINQIKDNLCNIQDDFLGYHENLKGKLKRSESAKLPEKKGEINS